MNRFCKRYRCRAQCTSGCHCCGHCCGHCILEVRDRKTFYFHKYVVSDSSNYLEGLCVAGKSEAILIQSLVTESNVVADTVKYMYP